ncbi:MAG TPA: PilT/PilU family type 4a pilus ATPase [Gammaproteobacteria bacterium]|nr:PilT/PilU family type 4a pilus ATPase [Gammaproteobacteria bacterium]
MQILDYLKLMVKYEASDLYFTVGAPVSAKIFGMLKPLEKTTLPSGQVKELAYSLMSEEQIALFEIKPEMNLAHSESGLGRFRVNIFKQRNQVAMVVRHIKTQIPSSEELGLPPILKKIVMQKRGLVLFVGGTGSGKSTSLAALIDYRNTNSAGHIITIEDPIEFIHNHKKSIVNQREVGLDTDSYEDALINTLRQAPDVILIGEIRDRETMEHAIAFAETGHLAISTLHANNANQALDRIINFFPDDRRSQLLMDLSLNVRAFISQRLIPTLDSKRTVAVEVLLGTPLIQDLILKGEIHTIKEIMEKSTNLGMQTFDQALFKLYKDGQISLEEALRNADSQNNLRLKISLSEGRTEVDSGLKMEEEADDPAVMGPRAGLLNMELAPKPR